MKNSNFAERLNSCLDKEGFPPKNKGRIQLLAEMVGLSHRGASKWINGESTPPSKKYPILAQKLKVNEQWLRTGEGEMSKIKKDSLAFSTEHYLIDVPIYDNNTFLTDARITIEILKCTLPYKGNFFGIKLDTEAMSPRFPQNSIIIFDNSQPKDGDFVLVNFDSYPSPIFRQLLIMGSTSYLNAHNPKFDRLILRNNSFIIGKLVQAILSFD